MKVSRWGWLSFILLITTLLVGCGGRTREGCEPEIEISESGAGSLIVDAPVVATPQDPETIQLIWRDGAHAETYVVATDNTNSSCARCHAPLDWTPTVEDIPANWVENQVEAASNPILLSELEWTHVDCQVCHSSGEDQTTRDLAWLEIAPLGTYSEVLTSIELCQKCHLLDDHEDHQALMIGGNHRDFLCTDCHDAHTTKATCSSSRCHEPFANECENINTHDKPHSEVTCSACHDAGEPVIKWNEALLAWDTFQLIPDNNSEEYEPYVSHNIVLEVDCDRCHAPGDHPWDP